MFNDKIIEKQDELKNYFVGEKEFRPWGYFEVLEVGQTGAEEFCKKEITMKPHTAMSVQRHSLRREIWDVTEGTLTAILNGELHTVPAGSRISIPLTAVHCMINLSDEKVVVREMQLGVCREEDNDRLSDINGRETLFIDPSDLNALESVALYQRIIKNL